METAHTAAAGLSHYKEFLIILGIAGLVVPLFLRIGVSAVLAFLIVGILISPDVAGRIAEAVTGGHDTAVIADVRNMSDLAELGVVFLLFLIGLELSFERLKTMRRLVLGLGGLQVVLSTIVLSLAARLLGFPFATAIIFGAALSLSSTAIVVELLSGAKRLGSQTGRVSFAALLAQDLAVIPLLLLVGLLSPRDDTGLITSVGLALAQAALAVIVIVLVGRFALRPVLRLVARTNSPDLFMAAVLLIAVGTGVAANTAGLSMALGAFVSGLMLAETEYRRAIEAIVEPFKGLLLGTFFLLVGMSLDLDGLIAQPVNIISAAVALIAVKAAIIYGLARLFRVPHAAAFETALLLGPCGEFAFVLLNQAETAGTVAPADMRAVPIIVTLTMIAIPLLARLGRKAALAIRARAPLPPEAAVALPDDRQPRVIIAGFGRVGRLIAAMLDEHAIPYIAIDSDPDVVARERRAGANIYYGDASNAEFLRKCGLAEARALAVTMDTPARVDDVARVARGERDDLKIVARARDERHAMRLYAQGVTEAVPETIESSLQLGEALLVETGVPMGLAIASVHERRDGFRKLLGRVNRRDALATKTLRQSGS